MSHLPSAKTMPIWDMVNKGLGLALGGWECQLVRGLPHGPPDRLRGRVTGCRAGAVRVGKPVFTRFSSVWTGYRVFLPYRRVVLSESVNIFYKIYSVEEILPYRHIHPVTRSSLCLLEFYPTTTRFLPGNYPARTPPRHENGRHQHPGTAHPVQSPAWGFAPVGVTQFSA